MAEPTRMWRAAWVTRLTIRNTTTLRLDRNPNSHSRMPSTTSVGIKVERNWVR